MLPGDDVLDLEGELVVRLGHPAIFAALAGPMPDLLGDRGAMPHRELRRRCLRALRAFYF